MGETATRTAAEAAGLRAAAVEASGQGPYRASVASAVTATLDWLEGATARTPLTGDDAAPDEARVVLERIRAEDAENLARRRGDDGLYPGVVGHTLSWWTRRQFTESPL